MGRTGSAMAVLGMYALILGAGANAMRAQDAPAGDAVGTWTGTLEAGGQRLRLVFHIERGEDGELSGALDSPDQGAYGLGLSAVEQQEDSVRFTLTSVAGEYTGRVSPDGASIEGQWAQAGARFPLALERTEEAAVAPVRPQEPKEPYPYAAEDLVFENPGAGIRLAGTLTLPAGAGPCPAVALISGSGPQDRDEKVFGHRPFLVLADYLSRRGIAVLRYDDRGTGPSTGVFGSATTDDFASDALAAVEYLTSRPEIDPSRIGLIGHSEGAVVAPIVADASPKVAFVVLLASTGVNGRDLLIMQARAVNRASGLGEDAVEARSAIQTRLLDAVVKATDDSVAAREARRILAEAGLTGQAAEVQVRALLTPWMRHFLIYDPLPALRRLRVPVLALNGELDTQVPPTENLPAVDRALREGGNPDATAEVLPGLNHMFQEANTGAPAEYAAIEQTMSPVALDRIADWIADRTNPR